MGPFPQHCAACTVDRRFGTLRMEVLGISCEAGSHHMSTAQENAPYSALARNTKLQGKIRYNKDSTWPRNPQKCKFDKGAALSSCQSPQTSPHQTLMRREPPLITANSIDDVFLAESDNRTSYLSEKPSDMSISKLTGHVSRNRTL